MSATESSKDPKSEVQEWLQKTWGWMEDTVWRHYKGDLYIVKAMFLEEHSLRMMVLYRSVERKSFWSRPLLEEDAKGEEKAWFSNVHDGILKPRFEQVK